jgi:hypothetical protein
MADNSYQANQDVIAGARAIRSNPAALAQLVALLNMCRASLHQPLPRMLQSPALLEASARALGLLLGMRPEALLKNSPLLTLPRLTQLA